MSSSSLSLFLLGERDRIEAEPEGTCAGDPGDGGVAGIAICGGGGT